MTPCRCGFDADWVLENPDDGVLTVAPPKVWCRCSNCGDRRALLYYEDPRVKRLSARVQALEGGIVAENARVVREHNELRAEIEDLKGLLAPRMCKHCGCEPAVVVTYCNELESDDVCPDCQSIPQPNWHPNALDNLLPEWCASAVSRFCRALAGRKIRIAEP